VRLLRETEEASTTGDIALLDILDSSSGMDTVAVVRSKPVSQERLLQSFFENFWPSFPMVLPLHYLQARRLRKDHGMDTLLPVLYWIGSLYAPQIPSEAYYKTALEAVHSHTLAHTPFNVQTLMLFALAQYHSDIREEARKTLDTAVTMAVELRMNEHHFAQTYGEGDAVLEESWRRTYYILHIIDQHFAIVSNTPFYTLLTIPNTVSLPCDDGAYTSGLIPPPVTWAEYCTRDIADVQVTYSSITYLHDISTIVAHIIRSFLYTATLSESVVETVDLKLASWFSLLPPCKKDPLQMNGEVDEVLFTAHMVHAIILSKLHRPFSALPRELETRTFGPASPFVIPGRSRNRHTAMVVKASEMAARLLAIPGQMERHGVFVLGVVAQIATVQVSACTYLLDGHALSIARDRVRLCIGFLDTMGEVWGLGREMSREVRGLARASLGSSTLRIAVSESTAILGTDLETGLVRELDEVIWHSDAPAQLDIYSGIVMPFDSDMVDL
jgi:hypothetical protein